MKIRITKKGLPKAQGLLSQPGVELRLPANPAYNYAWTNFGSQMTPPFPRPVVNTAPPDVPKISFPSSMMDLSEEEMTPPEVLEERSRVTPDNSLALSGIGPTYMMSDLDREVQSKYDSDPKYARNYDESVGFAMLQNFYGPKSTTSRKQMNQYVDFFNKKYDSDLKLPAVGPKLQKTAKKVDDSINALVTVGNVVDYFGNDKKAKEWERYFRTNAMKQAPSGEFEGIENINTGRMFENLLPKPNQGRMFAQDGGENMNIMKIRITSSPDKMEYGGQSNYGLDLGRRKVYADMPDAYSDSVSSTIQEVPRAAANIEAEGGETVYGDVDGDGAMEHMKIEGKRHTQGGVPLNVPEGSFIFSDTKKMRIKDPAVLAMFGKSYKKGGYTPAEIARQYDINKYKAIMDDPNADPISKGTAQLMASNYRKKLANLSLIQEQMKGFPQGVPEVASGLVDNPNMAKYGGNVLPKFQNGNTYIPDWLKITPLNPALQQAAQPTIQVERTSTKSPDQLADLSDPEYQKYMDLLKKYDTGTKKGAKYINSISDADAREFARLATKFGFSRTDASGKQALRVTQGATPGFVFEGSDKKKKGFFGGYRPEFYEKRVVEDALGEDAVKNMSDLDIRKAYFKELGVDTSGMSDDDLKDSKKLYTNKDFFEKTFYPKFTQRFGKADYRTLLGDDQLIGAEHFDAFKAKEKPQDGTVYGFICTGVSKDGYPQIQESAYMNAEARSKAGAYASRQEAMMNCPGGGDGGGDIPPGKKRPPTGFLTPDKLTLATSMMYPPKGYFPYVSDMEYRPAQLALEDWLSQAQNIQQIYNTSANTLGTYQPGTALASNLSFLSGQAGDQVSQAISQVGNRNVDRFNQFSTNEAQRRQAVDAYNTAARDKRWDGFTIAKQNLDNARRRYLTNITKSANNMWANRMYLDMINAVNPFFNIDPKSGLSYYTSQGYGTQDLGRAGSASGSSGINWKAMNQGYLDAKKDFPGLTEEQYIRLTNPRVSSVDTNNDGIPDRSTSSMMAMNPMMQMMPFLMSGIRNVNMIPQE